MAYFCGVVFVVFALGAMFGVFYLMYAFCLALAYSGAGSGYCFARPRRGWRFPCQWLQRAHPQFVPKRRSVLPLIRAEGRLGLKTMACNLERCALG